MTQGAILERWRLVLGEPAQSAMPLSGRQALEMDQVLDFLYRREAGQDEYQDTGGTGESQLTIPEWLHRVRTLFPQKTAQVLERHALDRYQMQELLTDPEILERMEPNQALLETILSLKPQMSGPVLAVARRIAARVAEELTRRMQLDFRKSLLGRLRRRLLLRRLRRRLLRGLLLLLLHRARPRHSPGSPVGGSDGVHLPG